MPYLKINYDDTKPTFQQVELPYEPKAWLSECCNILGCRSIQTVPTVLRGIVLVVDSEGKLFDGWQKRINRVASCFYGSDCDFVVGDVLLARVHGIKLLPLKPDVAENLIRRFS